MNATDTPTLHCDRPGELIIAVVGPTASGKSDLALDVAELLPSVLDATGGEIVSADSMQFYRGMDIGTAKTPLEERRGIPHHQIDTLDVTDEPSAALYQKEGRADIAAIHARHALAIVAGGSGLYQRALLDILDFPGTDPSIRARLEDEAAALGGAEKLHQRLQSLDPESASRIDARNPRRIVRALEVIELTGKPYSSHMPRHIFHAPTLMIGCQRSLDDLDQRIAVRTRAIFEAGLVEEVRNLIPAGLRRGRTASKATGYAQALAVIDGQMSETEAQDAVAMATRRLARKQLKWLRPDPRVVWLSTNEGAAPLIDQAREAIEREAEKVTSRADR